MARARLWLTIDEVAELTSALEAALAGFRGRRDLAVRPEGAREVELVTMVVPRPSV